VPIKAIGSEDIFEYVVFNQKSNVMQPAIWIGYKDSAYTHKANRRIKLDLPNIFVTKYMKVLMISAYRKSTNIHIDYVIPGGFLLEL